jgi:hypothetical protein
MVFHPLILPFSLVEKMRSFAPSKIARRAKQSPKSRAKVIQ